MSLFFKAIELGEKLWGGDKSEAISAARLLRGYFCCEATIWLYRATGLGLTRVKNRVFLNLGLLNLCFAIRILSRKRRESRKRRRQLTQTSKTRKRRGLSAGVAKITETTEMTKTTGIWGAKPRSPCTSAIIRGRFLRGAERHVNRTSRESWDLNDPRNRNYQSLAIANRNFGSRKLKSQWNRKLKSQWNRSVPEDVFGVAAIFFWVAIAIASDLWFEVAATRVTKLGTKLFMCLGMCSCFLLPINESSFQWSSSPSCIRMSQ